MKNDLDIRVQVGWSRHYKTRRLRNRIGYEQIHVLRHLCDRHGIIFAQMWPKNASERTMAALTPHESAG